MREIQHSLGIMIVAAVAVLLAIVPQPAAASKAAETYVQDLADQAMSVINDSSLSARQKKSELSDILDANIDIEKIAFFTLGQYRRDASDSDLAKYIPAFREYLIDFYVDKLSRYEGLTFKVTGSRDLGGQKGTVVCSEAMSAGEPTEINWRVENSSTITDVEIDGVWMAQDLREQLVSVIGSNGGHISAATERLKEIARR